MTDEQWRWVEEHQALSHKLIEGAILKSGVNLSTVDREMVVDSGMDAVMRCARNFDETKGRPGTILGLAINRAVRFAIQKAINKATIPLDDEVGYNDDPFTTGERELDEYAEAKLCGMSDREFSETHGVKMHRVRVMRETLKGILIDRGYDIG